MDSVKGEFISILSEVTLSIALGRNKYIAELRTESHDILLGHSMEITKRD